MKQIIERLKEEKKWIEDDYFECGYIEGHEWIRSEP
jgi:hypothetical protein